MGQLFCSFLGVDFQSLGRLKSEDVLEVGVIGVVKLFVLPVLLWAMATVCPRGGSAGAALERSLDRGHRSFIATLLGTSPNRMLQVTVLTSALVPLTLPGLVSLLLGQRLEIPYSHMARLLALIMLPPGILVFLLKRYAPRLAFPIERIAVPLGLPLFFFINVSIIAPFAGQVTGEFHHVLISMELATMLTVIFVASGLGISALWPRRIDGLSGALGLTCINNVLVAVFAARFFGPARPSWP